MTYTASSLTSTTPAQALLTALDALILAVTGWSKVSSALVVGTNTWNVYKSAGTSNSFGTDFYIAFGYVTATGTILHMTLFEQWASNLATNFPPNTTQTPNGTFANPNAAAALPTTGTTMAYIDTPALVTSGLTYGMTVTADRLIFWSLSGANQCGYYLGLYDPFLPVGIDPFPICIVQFGPNASASGLSMVTAPLSLSGMCTREPAQAASLASNFGCGAAQAAASAWTLNANFATEAYTGKNMLSRVLLAGRASAAFRGLLKDCYMGPPQTNAGDQMTWTINSVAHTAVRCGAAGSGAIYADQL